MSEQPFTQQDFEVFAYYRKAMLRVQQFELASTRLARLSEKISEDALFERVWKRLEK